MKKSGPKTRVFAVYDNAVKEYLQPFFAKTNTAALRSFEAATNQQGHSFNQYAADYVLHYIADFYPETGAMEAQLTAVPLATALELLRQQEDPAQLDLVAEAGNA